MEVGRRSISIKIKALSLFKNKERAFIIVCLNEPSSERHPKIIIGLTEY